MNSSLANTSSKLITNRNNIINISKGPQFATKGGAILAMVFLMFLVLTIACLLQAMYLLTLFFFFFRIIVFSIVIDVHGIEVNTCVHIIRDYKAFLWVRIGKWSNINDFKSIHLTKKNVIIRTSDYSDHFSDTYHYFHIKLVDELNKKEIFLAEYKNYYKAQKISSDIANATGLEFRDYIKGTIKNR